MTKKTKDPLTQLTEKMIEEATGSTETVTVRLQALEDTTFVEPCDIEAAELLRENHPTSEIIFQVGKKGWIHSHYGCAAIQVWDKTVLIDEESIENLIKGLKLAKALYFGIDKK